MVLSKSTIQTLLDEGRLKISPYDPEALQDISYRLHLDSVAVYPDTNQEKTINNDFHLLPGEFVLINSKEYVEIPDDLVGHMSTRSSAARLGLLVNFGSELIHPGHIGKICLEIKNLSNKPILLQSGLSLAQLYFEKVDATVNGKGNPHRDDDKPQMSTLCEEIKQ